MINLLFMIDNHNKALFWDSCKFKSMISASLRNWGQWIQSISSYDHLLHHSFMDTVKLSSRRFTNRP